MSNPVYVLSDNIRVFPCANRDQTRSRNARLTTEYNLVSIINKLVDKVSFVVFCDSDGVDVATSHMMSININGYLFTFPILEVLDQLTPSAGMKIYANINLQNFGDDSTAFYLESQEMINVNYNPRVEITQEASYLLDIENAEGDNCFVGLGFTANGPWDPVNGQIIDPDDVALYDDTESLHILTVTEWSATSKKVEVPQASRLKFETNTTGTRRSLKIDDGVI